MKAGNAVAGFVLVILLVPAGCLLPGIECASDEECADRWGTGARCVEIEGEDASLCERPCESDEECAPQVCSEGACSDVGPVDAGPPDAGPVDAGSDAGEPDAGHDSGPALECSVDAPCPTVANGSNVCSAFGVCELTCDAGYAECPGAMGSCTSVTTLENCGGCGVDVTGIATTCDDGVAQCGSADACSSDAGTLECAEAADGGFTCVACTEDAECGDGFCCQGECLPASARDESCGCEPQVGAGASEDCTARASERVCVDGTCGCTASGTAQCGVDSDVGLPQLCDDAVTTTGVCVAQSADQCGAVGQVVPAATTTPVEGPCDPLLGGGQCILPVGEELGQCGCEVTDDCTAPVLVDDVPRQPADACFGDACVCSSESGACDASEPDCTGAVGCVNLQTDSERCGTVLSDCSNAALGGFGVCLNGGCQCQLNTHCGPAANVDACTLVGDSPINRCVCRGFVLENGNEAACPMALDCVTDTQNALNAGCRYNGTIYKTMASLKTALGL